MADSVPLLAGSHLRSSRYVIKRFLAKGGFGAVYLAEDALMKGRPCVIKENYDQSPEGRAQFEVEATTLSYLNHPYLVRVTDRFVEPNQKLYLVMDYVEGEDLEATLSQAPNGLPEKQVLGWMDQIMGAVAYCHAFNPKVIHRDIKPANIRIRQADGMALLVDFGIAKIGGGQTQMAARGVSAGYAPPEQYGMGTDTYSDIYALGATLYHLLTGRTPPPSVDIAYAGAVLDRPRALNPQISSGTEEVILTAMQLNPRDRYQTVDRMRQALQGIRVCPSCATRNREIARFCQACGKSLSISASQYPVIRATAVEELRQIAGTGIVRVIGEVEEVKQLQTQNGAPYVFANFGDFRFGCFRVVFWSDALQRFTAKGITPESYRRRFVNVTGRVSIYLGQPQIAVGSPEDIEVLKDQAEAEARLKQSPSRSVSVSLPPIVQAVPVSQSASSPAAPPKPVTPSPPPPYHLMTGLTACTVEELAKQCEVNWDRAVEQFYQGSLEIWLRQIRQPALADQARRIALANNVGPIARGEGFAEWLSLAGYPGQAAVSVVGMSLGSLGIGEKSKIALKIHNSGTRYASGVVESGLPWLSVITPRFGSKPGTETEVEVAIDTSNLAPKTYTENRALVVKTKAQEVDVPVSLTIMPPVLRVAPRVLDLGEVRSNATFRATLTIYNDGADHLKGKVQSNVPWLAVPQAQFSCFARNSVQVDIECHPMRIPLGVVPLFESAALLIDCPHAPPRLCVAAKANILRPQLVVKPSVLDFGDVALGEAKSLTLQVSCINAPHLRFRILNQVPWLIAPQSQLTCVAGTSTRVLVRTDTSGMQFGWLAEPHALALLAESEKTELPASINIVAVK